MLVRVRSKDGTFRFPLEPTDDAAKLIEQVLQTTQNADHSTLTLSNQPRGGEMRAEDLKGTTLADLGIAHGHLLYANYSEASAPSTSSSVPSETAASSSTPATSATNGTQSTATNGSAAIITAKKPWETVKEDAVDTFWEAQDGKIPRSKDPKFCRHGDKAMCDYCMPLEPYDENFRLENSIKHLSFHAYLRKRDIATNKPSRSYIPPLEEEDYNVKVPCPSEQHPDWPAGICTKCQPSAITLQRQPYRMVDHVEFAHPQLIENLLNFWRSTGLQRFGFLIGRYEPYDKVPMGIKAVVEAIAEPPQEGDADGLTLGVPWEDAGRIEKLAQNCGNMSVVGMIYTDLSPLDPTFQDPEAAGKVLCKRHKDSFFLSGCEVLFSSTLQKSNPNPSRFSASGKYNSKFVTCVISGTEEGAIDVSAYQISEQGMAMVSADMIEASVNPNIIRVRPSEGKRYVPEVFYRYKNEYKIDVKESAKPTFPVEYLLITATHGFPNEPTPVFLSSKFPIENRPGLHDQNLTKALTSINSVLAGQELFPIGYAAMLNDTKGKGKMDINPELENAREKLVGILSDWHLICFLDTCGILDNDDIQALCKVAVSHDHRVDLDELLQKTGWQTLSAIAKESAPQPQDADAEDLAAIAAMDGGGNTKSGQTTGGGTGAYAGKVGDVRGAVPDSPIREAPVTRSSTTSHQPSGRRADSPILYTGSDDGDGDFDFAVDDDEELDEDEDMFEDAASSTAHGASANRRTGSTQASRQESPLPAPIPAPPPVASSVKACPHCTFENDASATDCDVCGLPL
ncbi:hypothetical protein L7F22_052622 [Adiantum nelumboides]|nr:hypothetical protein [Adiantum nelumboides]